jgi:hypothetical protein
MSQQAKHNTRCGCPEISTQVNSQSEKRLFFLPLDGRTVTLDSAILRMVAEWHGMTGTQASREINVDVGANNNLYNKFL